MAAPSHCRILILDFGAQYTQLIARRLRETNVYCEIHPLRCRRRVRARVRRRGASCSPADRRASPTVETPARARRGLELGVPVLGICYGMQTMAAQLGGKVEAGRVREFGHAEVRARGHSALFRGIEDRRNAEGHGLLDVWMSHGDKVIEPAARLRAHRLVAGLRRSPRWPTSRGASTACSSIPKSRIRRRARRSLRASRTTSAAAATTGTCTTTRARRSRRSARRWAATRCCSACRAASIRRSPRRCCTRDRRSAHLRVRRPRPAAAERGGAGDGYVRDAPRRRVIHVDASDEFLAALAGVDDPEAKRKIIGRLFVEVFQREAAKVEGVKWLAQGTIYPDVIESASAKAEQGAHDQVASQRRRLARDAASEAARAAARAVQGRGAQARARARPAARDGVSPSVSGPRPGRAHPGRGDARARRHPARAPMRFSSTSFGRRATKPGSRGTTASSQAFAVFLPVRSVGVMGDGRTYEHAVALRAVRDDRFHDGRTGRRCRTRCSPASATASPTRCAASTASSTTSPASRRRRSSGNDTRARVAAASAREPRPSAVPSRRCRRCARPMSTGWRRR